jgi:hypothetical protein
MKILQRKNRIVSTERGHVKVTYQKQATTWIIRRKMISMKKSLSKPTPIFNLSDRSLTSLFYTLAILRSLTILVILIIL